MINTTQLPGQLFKECLNPNRVRYVIKYNKYNLLWGQYPKTDFSNNQKWITLPCGKCLACLNKKANEWSRRMILESKLYKDNCFVTLTYDDEHLPFGGNLNQRDVQLFLKRLRKKIAPQRIRYRYSAEYGEKGTKRPHYHFLIFGWKPDDLKYRGQSKRNEKIYSSQFINALWGKGEINQVSTTLNIKTMKYVSKYISKINYTDVKKVAPFTRQSNKPGIAGDAFTSQIWKDKAIYIDGKSYALPRYFHKLAEKRLYELVEKIKIIKEAKKQVPEELLKLLEFWKPISFNEKVKKIRFWQEQNPVKSYFDFRMKIKKNYKLLKDCRIDTFHMLTKKEQIREQLRRKILLQ